MATSLKELTEQWGSPEDVNLYLNRCQVDTPERVVRTVWRLIAERRSRIAKVVDFGAGDGRFARAGAYDRYVGYEIDPQRTGTVRLSPTASIVHRCAFSARVADADLCVGNPPYVRNQDLPEHWRAQAAEVVELKTGVTISGLANAWQYFTLLALASTRPDGLVALVIPYEWVSRPSARELRDYIGSNGWAVDVYRLRDETFHRVLTTSSIALIDKSASQGKWKYFRENKNGDFDVLASPTGGKKGVLKYTRRATGESAYAKRGLSPGTQEVLTLTEGERAHHGLVIGADVVPCVTSLRQIDAMSKTLTKAIFDRQYKLAGAKCWLPRTDREPSGRLQAYFDGVPKHKRETSTCAAREVWWKYTMPIPASVFVASGFRNERPKALRNHIRAVAVGSVSGVYGLSQRDSESFVQTIQGADYREEVVTHSNGLRKLEIGQLETILARSVRARG